MVLSPLGDVDQRRQTSLPMGRAILRSSKGMWMRQMNTPKVSKLKIGRPGVRARMRGSCRVARTIATRPSASTIASPAYRRASAARRHGGTGRRRATRSAPRSSRPKIPSFYNVTLKNIATPWTNRDQSVFAPLNDYVATVIGMVRDDVPFNTALSADIIYTVQRRDAGGFGHQQRSLRERREQRGQPDRARCSRRRSRRCSASRPRPPRASSPRAPRPKRSSSTARTARCSASR